MTKDQDAKNSSINAKSTLLITFNFPPQVGGIETLTHDIMSHYPGTVIVLAPWHPDHEEFDQKQDFEVVRVKCPEGSLARIPFFVAKAIQFIRKNKVHHIQSANIFAGVVSMLVSKVFHIPFSIYALGKEVYILNTDLRSKPYRALFKRVLQSASCVLSISDFTSGEVMKAGVGEENIFKIPSGIDTTNLDEFDSSKYPAFEERVEAELGLKGRTVLLTIARLVERKGQDQVIRAMKSVSEKRDDVVYVIVGGGEMRPSLEKLVEELKLHEVVKFAGRVPDEDLLNFYHRADIFVMASRLVKETGDVEGFGQVFLEANYCGLPVIGGRSGGITDSVLDDVNGLLVDPDDPDDIAEKIIRLLDDKELRSRLGKTGKERVIQEFDQKKTVGSVHIGLQEYYL